MDAKAKKELDSIKSELNSIIRELDDIAGDIRRDFDGIGENACASRIEAVSGKYRTVLKKLRNIDVSNHSNTEGMHG